MKISLEQLEKVSNLYERGLFLQAYKIAKNYAPLNQWQGIRAKIFAGRLAWQLGSPRLGDALILRGWRENREDSEAKYYYARYIYRRYGILRAWEYIQQIEYLSDPTPRRQADWLSCRVHLLSEMRDFEAAEMWLEQADRLAPDYLWLDVERIYLLEMEDRYEEALTVGQHRLSLNPHYSPLIGAVANTLVMLDRDREALELLTNASVKLECGSIVIQLAQLQSELGMYTEAEQSYRRYEELSPLIDKDYRQWLTAKRSETAYYNNDFSKAISLAENVGTPFYQNFDLQISQEGERVILPVGFIRQHHMTCGPACLAMLGRFWSRPTEHLEIADKICYDGSPAQSQRQWAIENDYFVKEFTVTWESAIALIDKGIPFLLTTVEATSSHVQVIIGYDSRLKLLIARDPYQRFMVDFQADKMLEFQRAYGPRGMVLVPTDETYRLDGIELLDVNIYDRFYLLQQALLSHDRQTAEGIFNTMTAEFPEHRLTWQSFLSLKSYDGDRINYLLGIEKLLEKFPDNPNLLVIKLYCLDDLARRDEKMRILKELCSKPNHPVFLQMYGQALSDDAREQEESIKLLRAAIAFMPAYAEAYISLAIVYWKRRQFEESLQLYRFTTCLEDKRERYATAYFSASLYFKQTEPALQFLTNRFTRFGKKSSQYAQILFWAYEQINRTNEGFAILETAQKLLPEDGELLLYCATNYARYGQSNKAQILIDRTQGKVSQAAWLRSVAEIVLYQGERVRALSIYQELVDLEPLSIDTYRSVARLLEELHGYESVLSFLQQSIEKFPYSFSLHQLWSEWIYENNPQQNLERAESALRKLLEMNPIDYRTYSRLAKVLGEQKRFDAAFAAIERAMEINSNNSFLLSIHGNLYIAANRLVEAKKVLRESILLSVDMQSAILDLISIANTEAERLEVLEFVYHELMRQVSFGDGLITYVYCAKQNLTSDILNQKLRNLHQVHPALWQAWSSLIDQLKETNHLDEALDLADRATSQFPLLPRTWYDLALVYRDKQDIDGELRALHQALAINPSYASASRELSSVYERQENLTEAQSILEQAIARSPLDPYNYGCLADILWKQDLKELAIANLKKGIELEPGYTWAWQTLKVWSAQQQQSDLVIDMARNLTQKRSGEARSWLILGEYLTVDLEKNLVEAVEAMDMAISLNPQCWDAYDLKALTLTRVERYDEAIAACSPQIERELPPLLRTRAAWIEKQRGELEASLQKLHLVFQTDPSYYWARELAAQIYRQLKDYPKLLYTACCLVGLAPHYGYAWEFRGDAKLLSGDREGARLDFQKVIEIMPSSKFSGLLLFDLQLEDGELVAAEETLKILQKYHTASPEYLLYREVQLWASLESLPKCQKSLQELCLTATSDIDPLSQAIEVMQRNKFGKQAEEILVSVLAESNVNPFVGRILMKIYAEKKQWQKCELQIDKLQAGSKIWRESITSYLTNLATTLQDSRNNNYILAKRLQEFRFRNYLKKHRNNLRSHTYTWGYVGYTLIQINDLPATIKWLSDWKTRNEIEPWMLSNLVVALRWTKRDHEAHQVGKFALTLSPDYTTDEHRLFVAMDEALGGRIQVTESYLKAIKKSSLSLRELFQYELVEIIVSIRSTPIAQQFDVGRSQLKGTIQNYPQFVTDKLLRRIYTQTIWQIAKECGSFNTKVWAIWKYICLICTSDGTSSHSGASIIFAISILILSLIRFITGWR
ncbi:C39 family peptidase [Pseudanabaena sp. FACHB-1998]|uniref:C39 family peptidase n=1 Tax=Pseudanabaena sp. FACHB-1998 TaxID=2692858 RepID=UPI0016819FBF|nr:C39 family peptidase [Pseudanabaena sp. FACHB-1998]MBD2179307.1 C39 family peptidase [Pseudanabaena sp. FACHB-1998]